MKSKRFVARIDLEFDHEIDEKDLPDMLLKAMQHEAMPTGGARVATAPLPPDELLASTRPTPLEKLN